jgi:protein O-mannosyl-transferase
LENDQVIPDANSGDANPSLRQVLQQRKSLLLAALLIVATLLLYGPTADHKFLQLDDDAYVTANGNVTSGFSISNIKWAFSTLQMGHWHPLTWLSHMLDCQLFGLNPAGHHYSNVLLHALNVFLLFYLLMKATSSTWRSFTVAALFAVHPVNVEAVAWVAERKTLLSAFFCFLMFAAYGWYAKADSKAAAWLRYLAVVAAFLLALMAKAMAVTMPIALLLLDYWPLGRFTGKHAPSFGESSSAARTAAKLFIEKLPLFLIAAISSRIAMMAARSSGVLVVTVPLSLRIQNAITAYVAYLKIAFWPTGLSVYYPLSEEGIPWSKVVLALLVLGAITALTLKIRSQRYLVAGWFFFISTLFPVLGIVQVGGQAMADRYAYTPLIGIFIVVVWGAAEISKRVRISPAALVLATACALSGLAFVTHSTLGYWQDSLTLLTRAQQLAGKPDKFIETMLGKSYETQGLHNEAFQHLQLALTLDPHNALALYDMATVMLQRGQTRESIPELQAAIVYSKAPDVTESSLQNLGTAYLILGDYQRAELSYSAVLQLDSNRYRSFAGRGQAFFADAKYQDAANDFSSALRINPDPQLWLWLGKSLEAQHKSEQAIVAYTAALNGDPDSAEAKARIAALQNATQHNTPIR